MRRTGKQWGSGVGICAAILAVALTAQSSKQTGHDSTPMRRILVLGDSLSAGYLLRPNQAWPMLLLDKLRAGGLSFELTNASQSGGTTSGGLARVGAHLKPRIDIFILELGVNDAFRGEPIDRIERNLQEIIDRVRATNPEVQLVIAGMQLPDYSADDYVSAFGKMYTDLAERNRAALVPYLLEGVGGNPLLNLPDRIHPNAAGHKILADNVWSVLKPVAEQVSQQKNASAAGR